ncbi:MAG: flagellar biosynthetic protein FliO [Planctomycetota bacterium]|nr:flagellar biosynthetic protein FliO [Planctomycetota bacterium]
MSAATCRRRAGGRQVLSRRLPALALAVALVATAPVGEPYRVRAQGSSDPAPERRVDPGVPLEEFLQRGDAAVDPVDKGGTGSPLGLFVRFASTVALILLLTVGGFLLCRRWLPARRLGGELGDLRVVGRVSLGPRHAVFLLRCGPRSIAVGVSGDRMTCLGEFEAGEESLDEPLPVPRVSPRRRASRSMADRHEEFHGEMDDGDVDHTPRSADPPEMERLRGIFRNWKERKPGASVGGD